MFTDHQQLIVKIFVIFTSIGQIASESTYKTVPKFFSGSDGSQLSSIKLEDLEHYHYLIIEISLKSKCFIIDLHRKSDLATLPLIATEERKYLKCDEKTKIRHFNGKIRSRRESSVNLIICNGIWGTIHDDNENLVIASAAPRNDKDTINFNDEILVYQRIESAKKFVDYLNTSRDSFISATSTNRRVKRKTHDSLRYVELVLVISNQMYQDLGNDTARVNQRYINIVNILNKIFKSSNLFIALVERNILRDDRDFENLRLKDNYYYNRSHFRDCQSSTDVINKHGKSIENDLTLFMWTGGMALLYYNVITHVMCSSCSNIIVRDYLKDGEEFTATLIAEVLVSLLMGTNEIDHCDSNDLIWWKNCAAPYIAKSAEKLNEWKCLDNQPTQVLNNDKWWCGDGVIDEGEQCDHAWLKTYENPCCDAKTCQLIGNATCAHEICCNLQTCQLIEKATCGHGICCNLQTCQLIEKATCGHGICCNLQTCNMHNTSTVCRPAQHQCDVAEYCDGKTKYCPEDELIKAGQWYLDKMNEPKTGHIPQSDDWNSNSLIIELALVIDSTILKNLYGETSALNARYKEIVTLVQRLFQPLNISVALTHLEFWRNNVKLSNGEQQTYDTLQQYAQNLRKKGHVDNVQFIFYKSKFPNTRIFDDIKNSIYAFGTNSDGNNDSLDKLMQDLAYNIARYLGVSEKATTCPTFFCNLTSIPLVWCDCVLEQISSITKNRANLQCLLNTPSDSELYKGFDGPLCGNGLLEMGEECDCGVPEKCDIACCDAKRCRLRPDIPCPMSRG